MSPSLSDASAPRLAPLQWLIAIIAAIGFAFDSYVLLMLPLIVRPALIELLHVPPSSPAINDWVGVIFYVPAVAGGIFGLLGGYLTDLLGRRRVLVWSILLYAFSAFASGCCSGGAARSSASASSSSPQSPGCRNCSPIPSSASRWSATHRSSDRLAASWSRPPTTWS